MRTYEYAYVWKYLLLKIKTYTINKYKKGHMQQSRLWHVSGYTYILGFRPLKRVDVYDGGIHVRLPKQRQMEEESWAVIYISMPFLFAVGKLVLSSSLKSLIIGLLLLNFSSFVTLILT